MRNCKPRVKLKIQRQASNVLEIKQPYVNKTLVEDLERFLDEAKRGVIVAMVFTGMDRGSEGWHSWSGPSGYDYRPLNYQLHQCALDFDNCCMVYDFHAKGNDNTIHQEFAQRAEL